MGIIDLSRSFLREYGALGVMIDGGYRIEVKRSGEGLKVKGIDKEIMEVKRVYKQLKKKYHFDSGFEVKVKRRVPRHIGLGSTTQLHLGTASSMLKISGIEVDPVEIASCVGRSRFSAIGTHGFYHGGLILEGGKSNPKDVPPMTARFPLPDGWRFLVVSPIDEKGFDEVEEKPIMENMVVPEHFPKEISHHLVMGVLPSVVCNDLKDFGHHVSQIQKLVGESFSEQQGGTFHPAAEDIIKHLDKITYGAGQSSWGPTAYGITDTENIDSVMKRMKKWLSKKGRKAHLWKAKPNKTGARFKK